MTMEYSYLNPDEQVSAVPLLSFANPGKEPTAEDLIPEESALFAAKEDGTVKGVVMLTPIIVLGAYFPVKAPIDPVEMVKLVESHLPPGTVYYMLVPDGPGAQLPLELGMSDAGSVRLFVRQVDSQLVEG